SPGIPLNIPIIQKARAWNKLILSEIEFGFMIKDPELKIIAVTGSNGKSTTVCLIDHILRNGSINSAMGGNIGTAFTALPIENGELDVVLLEISSFQLDLLRNFRPDVAVVLNITPDHLNRYENFEHYARTKLSIFTNQRKGDLSIINMDDSVIRRFYKPGSSRLLGYSLQEKADIYFQDGKIKADKFSIPVAEISLQGPHNMANVMAALLAVSVFDCEIDYLRKALSSFSPLPHRLELITRKRGITFINDSKATNTEAVKYALQSFPASIRIIMGGRGKGEDYSILNDFLQAKVIKAYLIGESREEMKRVFSPVVKVASYGDLADAVHAAYDEASSNEIILLSPACTSFDMFLNFEERGDCFRKIVEELKE
ncbi:MAG: UDP-N-acetylmuramoyl-L-alanine--D-glutamate ligase, partial [Candidatus Cloacimonetes bacterium]|nr:UDP-N-acetylmuramoyl-L-alanine--D-glutamate ligase [Candidatus Cloacimonadota bacterium]